jgi:cytochrome c oxidase subunit 2
MSRRWLLGAVATLTALVGAVTAPWPSGVAAQGTGSQVAVSVSARKFAFDPRVIEVQEGDLVTVTLRAVDIPHSFTIDAYRISKRAAAGDAVTFEFRASQPGTFPFYCDLRIEDGCRQMRGELVVRPRR